MNKIRFPGVLADAECGVTEYPASSYPSLDIYFVPLVQNTSRRLSPAHTSHVTVSLLVLVLVWLPSKDLCQLSSLPWAPVSFAIQNLLCRKPLREKFSAPSYQTKYASEPIIASFMRLTYSCCCCLLIRTQWFTGNGTQMSYSH